MFAFMGGVQMSFVAMGYLAYELTGSATRLGFVHGAQAYQCWYWRYLAASWQIASTASV